MRRSPLLVFSVALSAAGCAGTQSALDPAGREAEQIADLFTWMVAGALTIWLTVLALAWYAPRARASQRASLLLITIGGIALPIVVLTALLVYGLSAIPRMTAPAPDDGMHVEVVGQQWWWRVRYVLPGRPPIELANEIHLPVGRRVNARLTSSDVIHSFWIPPLAGKLDMIPGRLTVLPLEPTRTGTFRGACAEFCGTSHARMNLIAVVTEQAAFDAWLTVQAQPAVKPTDPVAQRGRDLFLERGCVTCHTIRGTPARGVVGPDLTHVGSRRTIAAGLLPQRQDEIRRWIAHTDRLKPDVRMPTFTELPDDVLTALAAYLAQLE